MIDIKSFSKPKQQSSSSGGGASNIYNNGVSESWVDDNYVSKAFFQQLFTVHSLSDNSEVTPNNTTTQIANIESKYGFWSYSFISALGLSNNGGGGGASYLGDLSDVVLTNPTNGQGLIYDSTNQIWKNGNVGGGGGGGTGTVTSVAMTVPTGFSISGSPITSSGTLALSFASGYKLPTTSKQNSWDAGLNDISQIYSYFNIHGAALNAEHAGLADQAGTATTATTASKLSTVSKTAWGQQYWTSGGVPTNISGDMTSVGNISTGVEGGSINGFHSIEMNTNGSETGNGGFIDFHYNGSSSDYTSRIIEDSSGRIKVEATNGLRIGNGIIKWDSTNSCLMIQKYDGTACDIYATGGVSALGLSSGNSSVDSMVFAYVTVNERLSIGNNGSITIQNGGIKLSSPQAIRINNDNIYADPTGGFHANKIYLTSNTYIFGENNGLKFWNGSEEKNVILT